MKIITAIFLILLSFGCKNHEQEIRDSDNNPSSALAQSDSLQMNVHFDSLNFGNQIRSFNNYNKSFNRAKISGNYELCSEKLPGSIIQKIISFLAEEFSKSKNKVTLQLIKINLISTQDGWKVYTLKYRLEENSLEGLIIGCYSTDQHFVLSSVFKDVCSVKTLKGVFVSNNKLQVELCEYFNCTGDDEEFYKISITLGPNGIEDKSRTHLNQACDSIKLDDDFSVKILD